MKKNIFLFLIGAMLVFVACEPIEKRNTLAPAISEGELSSKVNISVSGNDVTCTIDSKNIVYWQTSSGKQANTKTAEFYFPLAGQYEISCSLFGGDEKVSLTETITIVNNDPEYYSDPMWELLTNNADGKTWVWADDSPNAPTWGIGPYLVASRGEWWGQNFPDLGNDQGAALDDEIYFDLNKAHNFSVTMNGSGRPGSGSGSFDMQLGGENVVLGGDGSSIWSYGKITFTNQTIPLGFNNNGEGQPLVYVYDILKLTEDELILAFPEEGVTWAWGAAWFYQFKRKGHTY